MALAGSTKSPRIESPRLLPVFIQRQRQRSLHQSVPLQARGESCAAAGARSTQFRIPTHSFTIQSNAIPAHGRTRNGNATKCQLLVSRLQHTTNGTYQSDIIDAKSILKSNQSVWFIIGRHTSTSLQSIGRCQLHQSRCSNGCGHERCGSNSLPRTTVLGHHCLLRTELSCR